jgi:hypothetical protein
VPPSGRARREPRFAAEPRLLVVRRPDPHDPQRLEHSLVGGGGDQLECPTALRARHRLVNQRRSAACKQSSAAFAAAHLAIRVHEVTEDQHYSSVAEHGKRRTPPPGAHITRDLKSGVAGSEYPALMSTHADRIAEQRKVKLDEIKEQVKAGSLKIRQMTAKERESNPPVPRKERRR